MDVSDENLRRGADVTPGGKGRCVTVVMKSFRKHECIARFLLIFGPLGQRRILGPDTRLVHLGVRTGTIMRQGLLAATGLGRVSFERVPGSAGGHLICWGVVGGMQRSRKSGLSCSVFDIAT